jgi:hypothetical protein
MRRARVTVLAVVLAVAAPAAAAGPAGAATTSPSTQAKSAWAHLITDTTTLPKSAASKKLRKQLLRTAKQGQKTWKRNPCKARSFSRKFAKQSKRVKTRKNKERSPAAGSPRGRLQADVVTVDAALLGLPKSKRCGGAKATGRLEPKASVLESSEKTLRVHVELPAVQFVAHQVGGKDYLEPTMEGMGVGGDVGDPGLPAMTHDFGIPEGANVSVKVGNVQGYTLKGVDLYPRQPSPVDGKKGDVPNTIADVPGAPQRSLFDEPPFKIDRKAYSSNAQFPAAPADGGAMGAMRDIAVGGVDTAGGQYQPKSKTLKVFTSMDLTVDFGGDNKGTFAPTTLLSPWNHAFVDDYSALLNFGAIVDRLRPVHPVFCGEELLIITSAELRPAANTLQAQRQAQGYLTSVKEVGAGPGQIGTTPAQIQAYIRSRLSSGCLIHPSYVILFGNTAHVPTFLVPCSPGGNPADCNIASDLDYSLNGIGTDLFADVQLGRLPARDLPSANALVTKLNTYATTNPAPPGDDFLNHAAVTSYFQPPLKCVLNDGESGTPNCDGESPGLNAHWEIDYPANTDTRGFTITAERIRNAIAADGYTVDRLYTTDDSDVIPTTYWNGTPIPSHLRRPDFAWDANTSDFLNAYNDGRFVILHRDHGWPDGWAEPTLHSGHVPGFTNGSQQAVVFGINCASAAFDDPAHPSFVELQVLRPDGGAIAGFGDTRVSPSFPNNHMALGYFDAMFSTTVSDFGGASLADETRRLGDIQVRGKQYMATQEGFEWHGAGDTYVEHYLYHLLGDPTMQMWSAPPVRFDPGRFRGEIKSIREFKVPEPGDPPYFVHFAFEGGASQPLALGTVVTVFRGDEAVGRGIVGADGQANIVPDVPFGDQDHLTLSLQQDGALPAQEGVDNPPPGKTDTKLSETCAASRHDDVAPMTTSGNLSPAFAGANIVVTYTRPNNGGTFERTVQTDGNGNWEDKITPSQESGQSSPDGIWKIKARYDGDGTHNGSVTDECTVEVANL